MLDDNSSENHYSNDSMPISVYGGVVVNKPVERALPKPPETIDDKVHKTELKITEHIRKHIIAYVAEKGNDYIAGTLGLNQIQLSALLSRKHWTMKFALTTALKLNIHVGAQLTFP